VSIGERQRRRTGGGGNDNNDVVLIGGGGGNPALQLICDVIAGLGGNTTLTLTSSNNRNNQLAKIFWFVMLFASYAFEQLTFKLLVDRVGPFRLFLADLILGVHASLMGLRMMLGRMIFRGGGGGGSRNNGDGGGGKRRREFEMMEMGALPLADIGREFLHRHHLFTCVGVGLAV
jgi:hypothetical protein